MGNVPASSLSLDSAAVMEAHPLVKGGHIAVLQARHRGKVHRRRVKEDAEAALTAEQEAIAKEAEAESRSKAKEEEAKATALAAALEAERDEVTKQPKMMYAKLPSDIAGRPVLLLDPMLATGGSAVMAIRVLVEQHGCRPDSIIFVNIVCCQEGLDAIAKAFPAVRVVTGAIDPVLDDNKYIVPGLGDFGDRYFGTG